MSSLIRYEAPSALSRWMDEVLEDNFFAWPSRQLSAANWPRVDIVEEKESYRLHADVPGLRKEEITITVENGLLTLSGEKKGEKREERKNNYAYYERTFGSFSRSFKLPEHVDAEHIEASLKDGVLELTINKKPAAQPRQISVNVH